MEPEARFRPGATVALVNLHRSCENSSYLLARVRRFLQLAGHPICSDPASADLVVVNTCVVTDAMRDANEQAILALIASRPELDVLVLGCLAGIERSRLAAKSQHRGRIAWVGPNELSRLDALFFADVAFASILSDKLLDFVSYQPAIGPCDHFLAVAQGCVNHCSYCNIRLAKGRVRSRPIHELLADADQIDPAPNGELVLLADDCGSYGKDLGRSLVDLVEAFAERRPRTRLKIYTIFPALFLEQYERLRPHFVEGRISYVCVPVQSGSERILKLMQRTTDLGALGDVLADIRDHAPHVVLFSHLMIGFPTETDLDFEASLAFAAHFDDCLFIGYGNNRETPAAALPRCREADIKERKRVIERRIAEGKLRGTVV